MNGLPRTARQIMTSISAAGILDAYLAEWGGPRRDIASLIVELRTTLITSVPAITDAAISIERMAWEPPAGFRNTVHVTGRDDQAHAGRAFTLPQLGEMRVTDNTDSALAKAQIAAALVYEMGFHGGPDDRADFSLTLGHGETDLGIRKQDARSISTTDDTDRSAMCHLSAYFDRSALSYEEQRYRRGACPPERPLRPQCIRRHFRPQRRADVREIGIEIRWYRIVEHYPATWHVVARRIDDTVRRN